MLLALSAVDLTDADRVGGKALNCARLLRAGFPVPHGLVVVADASDTELGRLLDDPWFSNWSATQHFAVRSSAIGEDGAGHSFAGIHETLLNVARSDIVAAVRTCRASTASAQALAYRRSRGLTDAPRAAVLIQPMVDAVVSGVAFTVDPVTGADALIIEAVTGLGEALVSGRVQPDHYRVRKPDGVVLDRTVLPGRQPLGDDIIRRLADALQRIAAYYGTPQDVEWAMDRSALWILQSRPITTGVPSPSAAFVDAGAADIEWTRANLAEVMPDHGSAQAVDAYEQLLNIAQRQLLGPLLAPEEELGPPFKVFGGRAFFNLSQLCHIGRFSRVPRAATLRSLGHSEGIRPEDEEAPARPSTRAIVRAVPTMVRLLWLGARTPQLLRRLDQRNAETRSRLSVDATSLDDREIWARLTEWRASAPDAMAVVLTLGGVMVYEEALRKACRSVGQDYDAFVYAQLAAGEPSVSTQQAFDLVELASVARQEPSAAAYFVERAGEADWHDVRERLRGTRFLEAFDRFLDKYGHRGQYESDWALPKYREDPTPLLFAIRTHLLNPPAESREVIAARLTRQAADGWASFDAKLSAWQRLTLRPRVKALLTRLKRRYLGREYCRSELVRVMYPARQLHLALAARFVDRGWLDTRDDYFVLLLSEIESVIAGRADPSTLRATVTARSAVRAREATLTMPLFMRQSELEQVLAGATITRTPQDGDVSDDHRLTGFCVSRGAVEAEVVVIRDPRDFTLMRRGAILVAPATDPSWTPLFTLAAGVIVEVGGILSHASTVAREYGLPALANVKHATARLRTGERVRLDASAGTVKRMPGTVDPVA